MSDGAGNRLRAARRVEPRAGGVAFNDFVGRGDRLDCYRIDLRRNSSFKLTLKSIGGNADVELIRDRNNNGLIDPGDVLASSRAQKTQGDSINIVGLAKGTYFIKVAPGSVGSANYRLSVAAKASSAVSKTYEVIEQTNLFREQNGLLPLAFNTQLNNASQNYSREMAVGDFLSHTSPTGSTIESRTRRSGYVPSWWAENIAAGYDTAEAVVQAWINSDSHRRNLLTPELREIGVGFSVLSPDPGIQTWETYWVQNFGTPITS